MLGASERTEHCRKQAAECAAAASATAIFDVKEAYRNLEQGWLKLAPEMIRAGLFQSVENRVKAKTIILKARSQ
jgi:hypothetical protein